MKIFSIAEMFITLNWCSNVVHQTYHDTIDITSYQNHGAEMCVRVSFDLVFDMYLLWRNQSEIQPQDPLDCYCNCHLFQIYGDPKFLDIPDPHFLWYFIQFILNHPVPSYGLGLSQMDSIGFCHLTKAQGLYSPVWGVKGWFAMYFDAPHRFFNLFESK